MAKQRGGKARTAPSADHSIRSGFVFRLVAFTLLLLGLGFSFIAFQDQMGEPVLLAILAFLAMLGVGFLFASVVGFVHIMPPASADDMSHAFLETMPDGVAISDNHGTVVYANSAYAELTGATDAADARLLPALLGDSLDAAAVIDRLSLSQIEGRADEGEFRLQRPIDGSSEGGARWYNARMRPFHVSGQRRPLTAWQLSDISTERAEQERFFLDLQKAIDHLDHAPAGFFATDADGRLIYLNATLAEWLEIDLANFEPGSLRVSDIVAGDGSALVDAVKIGKGTTRNAIIDVDLLTRRGEAIPVRFLHRVSAGKDAKRSTTRTIVLNRAIGDDSTDALRAAEIRFTRFFNSTPMAIASVNRDGAILQTNAPFLSLFGNVVDRDAIDNRIRFDTVLPDRAREQFAFALERARNRQADIEPIDTTLPNDEERFIRYYVSAIAGHASEGGEEAAIVYAVDMTEQKALEGQMAQSLKMQAVGQLAGGIAHDFNNVLTAIIMASDLLLTNHRPSDPSFPDIMNIKQNANRAAALVRQLLAFSRRQTLRPQVLNLTDVLGDIRMLLTRLVGSTVGLAIEHGRELWAIKTDVGQFEQVVVNLVVNARDAMPDGGDLTVRTRNVTEAESRSFGYRELEPAEYVLLEVSDTGTGIDSDTLKKIFEPFFTTKDVGKGTGLGLSMVYGIVRQTGGHIFCESEIGVGTTFRIFLPRHVLVEEVLEAADTAAVAVPAAARDLSGSARVLLVEDEDAVRLGSMRALTSRGYEVHEAASGVEALEIFKELDGKIDLIVSDVVMPEMDGPTLLNEVRKLQPDIRFIFVSGYAEDAFSRNLPEDARFGFLPKPFSLKQLATVVKEMLES